MGAKASLLSARQVPTAGGETEFADMRAAWDALHPDEQHDLEGKVAVHDYRFSHTPFGGLEILSQEELSYLPSVKHPVVSVHPETARKNLFIGRHASYIIGDDFTSNRQRLRQLTETTCQFPRTLKHRWRVGDLMIWDNRCVLHRGHPWPADQVRTVVRTTVAEDTPDNEWVLASERLARG